MFEKNISLKSLNTFAIEAYASRFARVSALDDLLRIISNHKDVFVLGGGSNILLTKNIDKPVIHLANKGIEVLKKTGSNKVLVKVHAGENWHDFVTWCIEHDLGGLENLSLIPGNVGASPMQNIGAYGVEIKDRFYELEALEIGSGRLVKFNASECRFGYRESIFKNEEKGNFIILNVTYELSTEKHVLSTAYGAIQSELNRMGIKKPGIREVGQAVTSIRRSKLPDPELLGNSGSFFKNPVISREHFERLQAAYPSIPHYPVSDEEVKVPAGWLVEQCGFKGYRSGDAGVHEKQALVLVNYGGATGKEILALSGEIRAAVLEEFGIDLQREVNVI